MQFIHRISFAGSPEIQAELAAMGIDVGDSGNNLITSLVTFEIDEADESWPAVQRWIVKRRAADIIRTSFSETEISGATWLELLPDWHRGYPQPREDTFGYLEATYDLADFCSQCGTGLKQKAPFQMKSEPKWGRNDILQLNWVFDEYFATPEVWRRVFRPHGIDSRSVTNTKGVELKTVVQLVAEEEVGVRVGGLAFEKCGRCSLIKYLPVRRGMFPALESEPTGHLAKTKEYFGSGGSAFNGVIVSQRLARALTAEKVRGVSVRPVDQPTMG